jgi:hypothetical protein
MTRWAPKHYSFTSANWHLKSQIAQTTIRDEDGMTDAIREMTASNSNVIGRNVRGIWASKQLCVKWNGAIGFTMWNIQKNHGGVFKFRLKGWIVVWGCSVVSSGRILHEAFDAMAPFWTVRDVLDNMSPILVIDVLYIASMGSQWPSWNWGDCDCDSEVISSISWGNTAPWKKLKILRIRISVCPDSLLELPRQDWHVHDPNITSFWNSICAANESLMSRHHLWKTII